MKDTFSMLDAFVSLTDVDDSIVDGMIKSRPITEGKTFSINSTADELEEAKTMLEQSADDEIEVIDVNADTLEHIKAKADYVGQFILTCKRCRCNRFVEADLLEPDEDDPDLYNLSDECPNCHSDNSGFELVGQVGKVQKPAASDDTEVDGDTTVDGDVAVDNDSISDDSDVTFDNDLDTTAAEEETVEVEDEANVESDEEDFSRFEEEEIDGMETTSSEDEIEEDDSELGDQIEAAKPKKDDNEDVAEAFKPDSDVFEMNKYAEEAWLMNRVISSMNNEEAYYGSWLYYWPDECDKEECAFTFNDKESFEELKAVFERVYKEYHEDELFDADEETLEYARKQDRLLGLRPIQNLKPRVKEQLTESFDTDSLKDLLNLIIDADDIKQVEVYDATSGNKVFEGPCTDLTPDLKASKLINFTVAKHGTLTLGVSSDITDEKAPKIKEVLKTFKNDNNNVALFEILDDGDEQELIVKDAAEAINVYGEMEVVDIEQPSVLKLFLDCPQMMSIEEEAKEPTEKLIEDIINANKLSINRVDKPFAPEYWIAESIYSGDDLNLIFEEYVRDHETLVYEFKKITGFRTKLEEQFMEEHDVGSLDDLYEQLYHIKKQEPEQLTEVFLDIATSVVDKNDSETEVVESFADDVYDRIYNDLVKLLSDEGYDTSDEYVKDYIEASVEEVYDLYMSVEDWFEDMQATYPEELNKLKKVNECKDRPSVRSFKDRKELADAIEECKNNTRPYTVRRSTIEGYRYDLIEDFDDEESTELAPVGNQEVQIVDNQGAFLLPMESRAVLNKISDVSQDIAEAIQKYYGIDADPALIVADIIQDLSLISGHIRPEDLEDTAINRLTIQMYNSYNDFYAFMDQLMGALTGESITSTPESKFRDAIKILNGPAFSKETIDKTIASERFLMAARTGAVPYIPANIVPRLTEDAVCEVCHHSPCECIQEGFNDVVYDEARDHMLDKLAENNFDISDKDVKLFVGNHVNDFVHKFESNVDEWFNFVSVNYKSALDRLQKLDYLEESYNDDLKGYTIEKQDNYFKVLDDNGEALDIDFESEDDAKEYINTISDDDISESTSTDKDVDTWKIEYNDGALQRCDQPNKTREVKGTWEDVLVELSDMLVDIPGEYDEEEDIYACSLEQFVSDYEDTADFSGSNVILQIKKDDQIVYQVSDYHDHWCDDLDEDVADFNPDDAASDQIDAEASSEISDAEKEAINKELSELDNPKRYIIKTSILVSGPNDAQVEEVEKFTANSKEEADIKYEELIQSGLYDEVEIPVAICEDIEEELNEGIFSSTSVLMYKQGNSWTPIATGTKTVNFNRFRDAYMNKYGGEMKDFKTVSEKEAKKLDRNYGMHKKKIPDVDKSMPSWARDYDKNASEAEKERQTGIEIAKNWKEREERERKAKADYERERYNNIKGSNVSNTGKAGVHYSGGDYYTESKSIKESGGAGFRLDNRDILDIEDLADAVYRDDEEYIKEYVARVNKDINVNDLSTAADISDYPKQIKHLIAHMKNKGYNTIGDFSKALDESKSIKEDVNCDDDCKYVVHFDIDGQNMDEWFDEESKARKYALANLDNGPVLYEIDEDGVEEPIEYFELDESKAITEA